MKDGNKGFTHQTQQHVRALQPQHQNPLLQSQQVRKYLLLHFLISYNISETWPLLAGIYIMQVVICSRCLYVAI